MADCNEIIEKIYCHPDINNLIGKIHPESIRDDLRQEIAVSLLEMPCDKVAELFANDNLLRYSIKICWLMATSKTTKFYNIYKKNNILSAIAYMESLQVSANNLPSAIYKAKLALDCKSEQTVHDDHERRIFEAYVNLGGIRKVARYYNIPVMHVCRVVNKVKSELKNICLSS